MTDVAERASAAAARWPESVFESSLLRGLDARGRRELAEAGRLLELGEGDAVYDAGDGGETFFILVKGLVSLRAVRRGEDAETELRRVVPGGAFGEEATVPAPRRARAVAVTASTAAEVPVHVFRRAAARSGTDSAERLEATLRRAATRDLLQTLALARDLSDDEIEALLDKVKWHRFERGQPIYREGDPSRELWLVADGLVQLQVDDGDRVHVRAYLARGDFFGDAELERRAPRLTSAIASGASLLASVPSDALRRLLAKHPDLLARLGRIAADQQEAQQNIVGAAAANHTQHAFKDLYRLKVARSLLTIDLETCVRCGHCSWACAEVHEGETLLVRRGDKIVTRVDAGPTGPLAALAGATREAAATVVPRSLMLPNSCQHCENPACMIDCPTGAIGRDPEGEVFIRDALCTGCGACAKACPWDNVVMAPRPASAPRPAGGAYPELAIKCDLCRDYESGPACVQSCPTESIFRMNPAEELADVRDLLGGPRRDERARARSVPAWSLISGTCLAAAAIAVVGAVMHGRGLWRPGAGWGLWAGWGAALSFVALLAYAIPKRGVRWWMRRRVAGEDVRAQDTGVRSRLAGHLTAHLAIGAVGLGAAIAHSPWPPSVRATPGSALLWAFVASSLLGAATALAYRLLPRTLARIERSAALPEDFPRDRRALLDRLYREVSGKSDLVKAIFERVLLRYERRTFGPLLLVASRRSLREEERALRARIDAGLGGRGAERLGGLAELVKIVVELRALVAQRWLQRVLRGGLVLHVAAFGVALVLLLVHVAQSVAARWGGG